MTSLVRKALWWASDYAYAAQWQLRGALGGRSADDYLSGDGRPVVVLPGIWESWHFMRPLIGSLHDAGHPVHVLDSLHFNGKPVERTARDVAAFIQGGDLRDVVLVAHSKGGLIGKYVMALLDDSHRVEGMAAICTPFSGSRYASFLVLPSLRAFSPRDPTTQLLGANLEINARILSIFGEFDPHIPEGSALEGATNVRMHAGGHFRILGLPETVRLVLEAAAAPPRPAPAGHP